MPKTEPQQVGTAIEQVDVNSIKLNPKNPRSIRKKDFEKLCNSIREFPKMLHLRPIVVNKQNIIVGGNMRYRAALEIGMTTVPIIRAENFTKKELERFLISDNVNYGDWDWEMLANEWDTDSLKDWNLHNKDWDAANIDPDTDLNPLAGKLDRFNNAAIKQIVLFFPSQEYEEVLVKLDAIAQELSAEDNTDTLLKLIEYYEATKGQ